MKRRGETLTVYYLVEKANLKRLCIIRLIREKANNGDCEKVSDCQSLWGGGLSRQSTEFL